MKVVPSTKKPITHLGEALQSLQQTKARVSELAAALKQQEIFAERYEGAVAALALIALPPGMTPAEAWQSNYKNIRGEEVPDDGTDDQTSGG